MNGSIAAVAIPDQHNEETAEFEVLSEGTIGSPEDLDVDAIAYPEVTEDQDAESSSHTKFTEDVTEYH